VKASEGIWKGVRAKEIREAMKAWKGGKEVYRERNKIEQVIGLIKVMCAEGGRLRWRGRDNNESEIVGMAVLLATGFDGFSFLFSILL